MAKFALVFAVGLFLNSVGQAMSLIPYWSCVSIGGQYRIEFSGYITDHSQRYLIGEGKVVVSRYGKVDISYDAVIWSGSYGDSFFVRDPRFSLHPSENDHELYFQGQVPLILDKSKYACIQLNPIE
jgi:hypothetical protein